MPPKGCDQCRRKHVKCTADIPACLACLKRGLACRYEDRNNRFRISKFVGEVHASPSVASGLSPAFSPPRISGISPGVSPNISTGISPSGISPLGISDVAVSPATSAGTVSIESHSTAASELIASPDEAVQITVASMLNPERSRLLYDPYRRVMDNIDEIRLFQFYVDHASKYLDACTESRHFSTTVRELCLTCPLLYYAVLSYSYTVFSRLEGDTVDDELDQLATSRCYKLLIPALDDAQCLNDPALLTAIVILRMAEQFRFQNAWEDPKSHLRGAFSIVAEDPMWQMGGSGLREVSFWVYARQDIRAAILERRPCIFNVSDNIQFFEVRFDSIFTNRITYLTTRACNWAFGTWADEEARLDTKRALIDQVDEWYAKKPAAFDPVSLLPGHSPFPHITYLYPWHTIALQFYYFCKLLLGEGDLRYNARTLCGLTMSCNDPGTNANGSHLIGYAGQFLVTQEERTSVVSYLKEITRRTGWPNNAIWQGLEQFWSSS